MSRDSYRFEFHEALPLKEAERTLHLATYAAEGLYGDARVRLDASHRIDKERHAIIVGAETAVGIAISKIFTGLLIREFGASSFAVRAAQSHVPKHQEGSGR